MKAAICPHYGPPDVLLVRDVADPVPGAKDVLIRIHATAVTLSDCYIRSAVPTASLAARMMLRLAMGVTRPRRPILGAVLSGEIEAVGKGIRRYRVGDRVWGFTLMRMGCYAERICLPANFKLLTLAPSNLDHDEAAAIPYGGLLSGYFLRKANIKRGQHVLIYGASGANGTCAVQIAKSYGAHVTAVCSAANMELVRSLGADAVFDYTREPVLELGRYDVVFDAVGRRRSSALKMAAKNALTRGGKYTSVDDTLPRVRRDDLLQLKKLVEAGKLKPVIDRRYSLEQIADAHRFVEQGHKKGNVIVTIG